MDKLLERVRLILPLELGLQIYSYIFFIDLEAFQSARAEWNNIRKHGLPSRAAFLELDKYRKMIQPKRGSPNLWEENVEEAFFQDTNVEQTMRIIKILDHGERSVWAPVLQRMGISLTHTYITRNQVVAHIIEAMTGQRLDRKQVGCHLRALQKLQRVSPMSKSGSPIIVSILSMSDKPRNTMLDNIYDLLHSSPLKIDDTEAGRVNSLDTLDFLIKSISPAFRQAIECIHLRYKTKQIDLTKFLDTFQHKNLPGLRELYLQRGERGQMLLAPPICITSYTEHRDTHGRVN
ncbi:MAG: hypothetical protein Q9174_001842 [Haloplaca sp. 1 TL-2023]